VNVYSTILRGVEQAGWHKETERHGNDEIDVLLVVSWHLAGCKLLTPFISSLGVISAYLPSGERIPFVNFQSQVVGSDL
jgi:hypothetical protein